MVLLGDIAPGRFAGEAASLLHVAVGRDVTVEPSGGEVIEGRSGDGSIHTTTS
jgi:hypothetical protein